ncbi:MAG TPA: aryl-sulfate sulfotransferase [Gammaproteobacteria bacterium]|jgi:outer membrane protein assembly factor BamB|nr:aryl-sulfate sulfotransferase [Gammaproteobacteria bacterium]
MTTALRPLATVLLAAASFAIGAAPSVYPTGTTIYDPTKTWNGYTVLSPLQTQAVIVIDMNGNVVKRWDGFNDSAGGPARILPGGTVVAAAGARPNHQESLELVQRTFDGKVAWQFDHNQQIETRDGKTIWSARQHHDWQRSDFPAGYYSPAATPAQTGAKTLLLTHTSHENAAVAPGMLEDDRLIEVSWDGRVLWEWQVSDHIDELGFHAAARAAIRAGAGANPARGGFDWFHMNSATYVGPNHWFDAGDQRFAPDNVIVSSRQASLLAIVARDGRIVWRLGPDFGETEALRKIRQIIGQHHAHLIPPGLPGAGNLLVFDNGGASGYGAPTAVAPDGQGIFARANSRVLEIDPVTLELVWSYVSPAQFYSSNISSAQRLPNGNTLVTEGAPGRVFEVTRDGTLVWEYMSPFFGTAGPRPSNAVYRAYRLPYDWIPQLERPKEHAVTPPALGDYKLR